MKSYYKNACNITFYLIQCIYNSNIQKKGNEMNANEMVTKMRNEMAIENCKNFQIAVAAFQVAVEKAVQITKIEENETFDKAQEDC